MSDHRLAQVWFASRPGEWDVLDPWVRRHELSGCGYLIRLRPVSWIRV